MILTLEIYYYCWYKLCALIFENTEKLTHMALYENVFIIRQDVSSADVDRLVEELTKFITEHNSKVVKTEYWGLRSLAYDINNNKKGHYVMLCIDGQPTLVKELERKMKYSEDVIRFATIRVNEFSKDSSPILKAKNDGFEEVVDVTVEQ
jgi:small subunit ribosomal protein S6